MASKLTKVVANFETSLATKLANGATSGALTSILDKNGINLVNGKYCMIIDRGTGDEEHLLFDLVSNAISNIISVSRQGVQTVGVQNLNGHRAGAKCYLTDFVNLKLIVDIVNGVDTLDATSPLRYDADPTFTDSKQLISKGYVDTKVASFITNLLSGNNVFTGLNSFTQSPQVPTPTTANDAANMSYVLSLVFGGGVVAGINKMTVNYDAFGRVKNVRDNELGKIYIISYDTQDNPTKIFDGTSTWRFVYSNDRLVAITKP
jgi:YD repeat-containing protein